MARLAHERVVVSRGRFAPDALIVEEGQPLGGTGLEQGWFVVQDEASQLLALLTGAQPGGRVLDTCAAPGGKTTAIAARMDRKSLLVACDVRDRRMELLRRTVDVTGAANVRLVQADLTRPPPFSRRFDCVFVDAPCSGLGTLRRDPDIKWRRREDELPSMAAHELRLLRHAADAVAPGGRLDLHHVLERARRKRARRGGVSRRRDRVRSCGRVETRLPSCRRSSSIRAVICERIRMCTAWKLSSAPCSRRPGR